MKTLKLTTTFFLLINLTCFAGESEGGGASPNNKSDQHCIFIKAATNTKNETVKPKYILVCRAVKKYK